MPEQSRRQRNKFGVLNSWTSDEQEELKYDQNSGFLSTLYSVAQDKYKKNALAGFTEFKAIVLRADRYVTEVTPGFFNLTALSSFLQQEGSHSNKDNLRVIARIPELHAHLPEPKPPEGNNYDEEILAMYPVFEGNSEQEAPTVGDIVRVSFSNIRSLEEPVYIGPVGGGNTIEKKAEGGGQAKSFNGTRTNSDLKKIKVVASNELYFPSHTNAKSKIKPPVNPINDPQGFAGHARKFSPTQIVIHESVSATREKTYRTLLRKGAGVHFLIDTDAKTYKTENPDRIVYHANILNDTSIGIEIINKYYAKKDDENVLTGTWVHRGRYNIPPQAQVESAWRLIKYLSIEWDIPMAFPGVTNLRKDGRPHSDGKRRFSWTRVPNSQGEPGIRAHTRTGHADGAFIEHYVLCRASGYSKERAYKYTIQQAQKGFYTQVP